jgi:hypothetical protein
MKLCIGMVVCRMVLTPQQVRQILTSYNWRLHQLVKEQVFILTIELGGNIQIASTNTKVFATI